MRGRCKLCKLVVRRAREMRRFKRYRLLCKDKMFKITSALHKARSVAGQLGQRITLQERRSHRLVVVVVVVVALFSVFKQPKAA